MAHIVDNFWLCTKKYLDGRTYMKLIENVMNDSTDHLPPGIFGYCEENDTIYRLDVNGAWEEFITNAVFTGTVDVDSYLYNKLPNGAIDYDNNIYVPTPKMKVHDDIEAWDWLHLAQPATADDILEADVVKTDKGWSSFDTYFAAVNTTQEGNQYMNELVTDALQPKFVVVNDAAEMTDPSKFYLLSDGAQYGLYIFDKVTSQPVKLGDKEVDLSLYCTKVRASEILDKKILTQRQGQEGQLVTLDAAGLIHYIDKYDLTKFVTEEYVNSEADKYIDSVTPDGLEGQVFSTQDEGAGLVTEWVTRPGTEPEDVILESITNLPKAKFQRLMNNVDDNTYTIVPPTVADSKQMFLYAEGSNNTTLLFQGAKMKNSDDSTHTMRYGYNYEYELNYVKEMGMWVVEVHEFGSNCYIDIEVDAGNLFSFDPNAFFKDADDLAADVNDKVSSEITGIGIRYKLNDPL